MPLNQTARLHAVRTAWQRVQCEVAYVRVLMAASRFREALLREERDPVQLTEHAQEIEKAAQRAALVQLKRALIVTDAPPT